MMRILALVPGGLDNQLLFFPTLDDLNRAYPQAQVDVAVEPRSVEAYRVCKFVSQLIRFDFEGPNSMADWGNFLGQIRDRNYDAVLSLEQGWATGLVLWLTGVPVRVGYAGGRSAFLLTQTVPRQLNQYRANLYHDLLLGLGIDTPCPSLAINVPVKDIEWAEAERTRLGINATGYVLIDGGIGKEPSYPVESWQQIWCDLQKRQPDLPVIVRQEANRSEWVAALAANCPNLKITSPADIGKLAAMIAGASLLLCTEDLSMHLAVAVQTYTVALMGSPTDPKHYLPNSDKFIGLQSPTQKLADLQPQAVLEQIWQGS
jgi:ADP-heptose:LPS heptosyltransferase